MPNRRHLSVRDMERILGMLQAGATQRYAAAQFGVTQSVVQRIWQRFLDTGSVEERPKSGRPRKTSAVDDRYIVTMSRRQRFDTARTLNQQFLHATGITICEQTIRNRLHDNGIHARRPAVRPPLTRDHRTARRQFAAQYEDVPLGSLRKILFTDESRFCVDNSDGRKCVWRRKNERFVNCCVAEHDRWGGPSVMVWGGISFDGVTDLYVIQNGALTGVRYRDEILDVYVRPFAGAVGDNFVLMDDNARPHRARVVNDYLEDEGIERLDWPSRSPDLNPIEHAWDALQRRINARMAQPQTAQQLANALLEEWVRIPRKDIQTLVLSFWTHCTEVIDARGGHTRY